MSEMIQIEAEKIKQAKALVARIRQMVDDDKLTKSTKELLALVESLPNS